MLPKFLSDGGWMIWLIMATSAVALAVFLERLLQYHREQINSGEFLNGVRNVLKRDNVVEALAICDATPGPVARLVKVAVLNRERSRFAVQEALEDAGAWEVTRLEQKLHLLATIAQIAPLMGLLGTVLGFMDVFKEIEAAGLSAHASQLSKGIWEALTCTAAGLAVAIPAYAGYNYLVGRVNAIVLDMEQASSEIVNIVIPAPGGEAGPGVTVPK
jgi:biopolymer transport protein ExbB